MIGGDYDLMNWCCTRLTVQSILIGVGLQIQVKGDMHEMSRMETDGSRTSSGPHTADFILYLTDQVLISCIIFK